MKISLPIVVIAFETDFGGVVSNTRHIEYIERGRYALMHAAEIQITKVWAQYEIQPVVRRVEIDYLGFARHEDELILNIQVGDYRGAGATLRYELRRKSDGAILMRAIQTLAFINAQSKPVRVPQWFRDALPAEAKPVL